MTLKEAAIEAAKQQILAITRGATDDPNAVDQSKLDGPDSLGTAETIGKLLDADPDHIEEMLRRADGAAARMAAMHAEEAGHPGELCVEIVRTIVMCATTDALVTGVLLGRAQGADATSGLADSLADLPTIEPGDAA